MELFAGLRTTHVAAQKVKRLQIALSVAAESCPFANSVARKNRIKERLFVNVKDLDDRWANSFVASCLVGGVTGDGHSHYSGLPV